MFNKTSTYTQALRAQGRHGSPTTGHLPRGRHPKSRIMTSRMRVTTCWRHACQMHVTRTYHACTHTNTHMHTCRHLHTSAKMRAQTQAVSTHHHTQKDTQKHRKTETRNLLGKLNVMHVACFPKAAVSITFQFTLIYLSRVRPRASVYEADYVSALRCEQKSHVLFECEIFLALF